MAPTVGGIGDKLPFDLSFDLSLPDNLCRLYDDVDDESELLCELQVLLEE